MKTIFSLFVVVCLAVFLISSCEQLDTLHQDRTGFRLKFSDGLQISQSDIQFYDSATNMLFLKGNVELGNSVTDFSVLISDDTVYEGIIYYCYMSSLPSETFFISNCNFYGPSVIELEYYPYGPDLRNDPRIISLFKKSGQLLNGISCEIDDITVINHESSSEVTCKITITNHDPIRYYILDPAKMGSLKFAYYTGGISFRDIETGSSSFLRWSEQYPDYEDISISDLSVLKGYSQITYTFSSSDYHKMEAGNYTAHFAFCGIKNTKYPPQDRNVGRVWVGRSWSEEEVVVGEGRR